MKIKSWHVALLLTVLVGIGAATYFTLQAKRGATVYTVGDVIAVHAPITVGDTTVQGERRISDGDTVVSGPDGRARVVLDDGTIVAVDGNTRFTLTGSLLSLEDGRIFVQAGATASTEVTVANGKTTVASSAVAFESNGPSEGKIYCANGELVLDVAGQQSRVQSGEVATLKGGGVAVAPEKVFDDWTGGLAVPWTSALGGRSTIGQVRAVNNATDPGTALVVRSQRVEVEMVGEVAVTRARTTYFNGSESATSANLHLALPQGAILRRVARRDGDAPARDAVLSIASAPDSATSLPPGLQWAGGGWLRGDLGEVGAGKTTELILEYVEWLTMRADRASYRFLMAGGAEPPLVGEISAEVDATQTATPFLTATSGATVEKRVVRYRRSDVRPTGDLVVELAPAIVVPGRARAYVQTASKGEDPFVMVRTEVPEKQDTGVTLALVVDTSMSIGASTLETERAVIDALLEGLGSNDAVVVLAADQSVSAVGPAQPEPVSPAVRTKIRQALGALRPGGASNVGLALQTAADILDAPSRGDRAGSGMVVYVGDGRATVGASDARALRRLLARRAGGIPRLGAIAVGPAADRWLLANLVHGVGSLYEVPDRSAAGQAGAALLTDALKTTLRDVKIDLGPTIDRIYPRDSRAVLAGSTVTVLGRLRGNLPQRIGFSYRDGAKLVETSRLLRRQPLPPDGDLVQRWASARIEDMAVRDEPIEPAVALALESKLVTPWTGWFFGGASGAKEVPGFAARVLELAPAYDTAFAGRVDPVILPGSTLLEPPRRFGGGVSLQAAVEQALRGVLQRARNAVRACRDARASVRPEVGRTFTIDLSVSGEGKATRVRVTLDEVRGGDPVLERCVRGVVESLPFYAAGIGATITHKLKVPERRASQRTKCSGASKLALPIRKSIWRARGEYEAEAYLAAARSCELPAWADRRAFLELMLDAAPNGNRRLEVARDLDTEGESDAASFIRRETLRRVTTFDELQRLSRLLVDDEPQIDDELLLAYAKADSDEQRLVVVRDFLRLAPHSPLANRRLLALLEALGRRDALIQQIHSLRAEPIADAGLLAQAASALRRLGLADEGRRVFGELIERAPGDPWTLGYTGDRLRAEGLFDEASAAYDSLDRVMPNDAGVTLRLALAHAGAGRLDVATRLLERISQTGGRDDDGRVGELASITRAVLLAGARGDAEPQVEAQLERRLLQTPLPDVASVVLVRSAPADDPIEVRIEREQGEREQQTPDFDASSLGIAAIRIERGDGPTRIILKRRAEPEPSRPALATVTALVLSQDRSKVRLLARDVQVPADGNAVELRFDGEAFL